MGGQHADAADPGRPDDVATRNGQAEREGQGGADRQVTVEGNKGSLGFDDQPVELEHRGGRHVGVEGLIRYLAENGQPSIIDWPDRIANFHARLRTLWRAGRATSLMVGKWPRIRGSGARPLARRGDGDSQGGSDMSSAQLYDTIGATYTVTRRTEPRIAARVWAALGDARTVLNVGAGTGSYEPPGRDVTAVEPSALMRAQRPAGAAPCVAAAAESLPFGDQYFDAAMAVCTVHHWQDPIAGLREMRRVARRVVVFLFDTSDPSQFWLTRDYLPEFAALRACRVLASLPELARAIGARTEPVLIPWDCADGFFEAYWRRPEAYLDDRVRRGISVWARVGPDAEQRAVRSLRHDLASGRWAERNRDLVDLDAAELGARLLVT